MLCWRTHRSISAARLSISASYAQTWKHVPSCSISLCKIDHPVGKSHLWPLGGIWTASRRERWDGGGKGSYGRIEGQDGAPWPDSGWQGSGVPPALGVRLWRRSTPTRCGGMELRAPANEKHLKEKGAGGR